MRRTWKRLIAWLKWNGWLEAEWFQQRWEVEAPQFLGPHKLRAILAHRAKRRPA